MRKPAPAFVKRRRGWAIPPISRAAACAAQDGPCRRDHSDRGERTLITPVFLSVLDGLRRHLSEQRLDLRYFSTAGRALFGSCDA